MTIKAFTRGFNAGLLAFWRTLRPKQLESAARCSAGVHHWWRYWSYLGVMAFCHVLFVWVVIWYESSYVDPDPRGSALVLGVFIVPLTWLFAPMCIYRMHRSLSERSSTVRSVHLAAALLLYLTFFAPLAFIMLRRACDKE